MPLAHLTHGETPILVAAIVAGVVCGLFLGLRLLLGRAERRDR